MLNTPLPLEVETRCHPGPAADPGPQVTPAPTKTPAQPVTDQYAYLLGRPTISSFLRFFANRASPARDKAALLEQWQAAHQHLRALENTEAGWSDHARTEKLGSRYTPLLLELFKHPLIRHAYNTVPTEVAWVELDRLVVYQRHLDLTFLEQLKHQLGPSPTPEQVFRVCLPFQHPSTPIAWSRLRNNRFVFTSVSNDLRFLGAMPLQSRHITGYPPPGSLAEVVGLAVGFGSNFLNALRVQNRIILNNGSHRACALRELGITRVPCIVQHVSNAAELELVAPAPIRRDPDQYLKHPRPPLLKDYFDPSLRTVLSVQRLYRQVTVRFQVDETYTPALPDEEGVSCAHSQILAGRGSPD